MSHCRPEKNRIISDIVHLMHDVALTRSDNELGMNFGGVAAQRPAETRGGRYRCSDSTAYHPATRWRPFGENHRSCNRLCRNRDNGTSQLEDRNVGTDG